MLQWLRYLSIPLSAILHFLLWMQWLDALFISSLKSVSQSIRHTTAANQFINNSRQITITYDECMIHMTCHFEVNNTKKWGVRRRTCGEKEAKADGKKEWQADRHIGRKKQEVIDHKNPWENDLNRCLRLRFRFDLRCTVHDYLAGVVTCVDNGRTH